MNSSETDKTSETIDLCQLRELCDLLLVGQLSGVKMQNTDRFFNICLVM